MKIPVTPTNANGYRDTQKLLPNACIECISTNSGDKQ